MKLLSLYITLAGAGLRSQLQYRANCVLLILMGFIWQGTGFIFIWVVLSQFHEIAGWTLGEVAFLYGFRLIIHALSMLIFGLFQYLENIVRWGEFDVFLVRPLSPFLQVMTYTFPIASFGDLLGGIVVFVAATLRVNIAWSPLEVLYLLLAIIGGCLVETAIKLAASALVFRTLSVWDLVSFFDDTLSLAGNYPLTIYGSIIRFFLTFIFPLAFLAYLPVTVLLHHTNELSISPIFAFLSPLAGIVLFALAYCFFEHERRYYQSAGH